MLPILIRAECLKFIAGFNRVDLRYNPFFPYDRLIFFFHANALANWKNFARFDRK